MSERRRLPNRRASETFAIHSNGLDYIATVSHFDDGALARFSLQSTTLALTSTPAPAIAPSWPLSPFNVAPRSTLFAKRFVVMAAARPSAR